MVARSMARRDGLRAAAVAGVALLALSPASASEIITYGYDARGRLVKVSRSGTVNNNVTACYTYDKADNRTNVKVQGSDCTAVTGSTSTTSTTSTITDVGTTIEDTPSTGTADPTGTTTEPATTDTTTSTSTDPASDTGATTAPAEEPAPAPDAPGGGA